MPTNYDLLTDDYDSDNYDLACETVKAICREYSPLSEIEPIGDFEYNTNTATQRLNNIKRDAVSNHRGNN